MKSMSTYSLTLLVVFLLGLCSLNVASVSAKTIVRGDHRPKTLKHFSMHSRQLMKDEGDDEKEKGKDKDPDEDQDEDQDQGPQKGEEEDEEDEEDEEETTEETMPPVVENAEGDELVDDVMDMNLTEAATMPPVVTTPPEEPITEETTFTVALEPFSLTIDGSIAEDDLNLDEYLLNYMQQFMANLIAIDLEASVVEEPEDEPEEMPPTDNSTRTRSLRAFQVARVLAVQTFYFEGTATFQGLPERTPEEVDSALTYALEDTAALQAHLVSSVPAGTNATITGTKPKDPKPDTEIIAVEEEAVEDSGISTTGLSIVIVAAVIGGLSLIIIMMVGMSGPSGSTGGKGGLPEQPLQ